MTGIELKGYLDDLSDLIKDENCYMVEKIGGELYSRVPTNYKSIKINYIRLYIELYRLKYGDGDLHISFNLNKTNLYATYKLRDLTLPILIKELDKFFLSNKDYKIRVRNLKINSLV